MQVMWKQIEYAESHLESHYEESIQHHQILPARDTLKTKMLGLWNHIEYEESHQESRYMNNHLNMIKFYSVCIHMK